MSIDRSERRKRVAMIRWVLRFPDMVETVHKEMWRVGFGRDPMPDELRSLDNELRDITNYHARFRGELPDLFHSTSPSELAIGQFNEVYTAFEREFSNCFDGLYQLEGYLTRGLQRPVKDGGTVSIPFPSIYKAIDIEQPKRILRMAAEEISHLFPPDETEEAIHGGGTVIEEYIVGDKFENIKDSTIINRSRVERAFNRTEEKLDDEVASAILEIAQHVDRSGNPAAGAVFDEFTQEVNQDEPDKSKLRQYWDGLIAILPDIATLAGAGAAISRLFS